METACANSMALNKQQQLTHAALPPAFPAPPPAELSHQVDAIVQEAMQYLQERGLDPFDGGSEGVVQQAFGMVAANAIAAAATAMSCHLLSTLAPTTTPGSRRRQTPADEQAAAAGEQQEAKRQRSDGALLLCPRKTSSTETIPETMLPASAPAVPESAVPAAVIDEGVTAGAQQQGQQAQQFSPNTATAAMMIDLTTEDDAVMQTPVEGGEDAAAAGGEGGVEGRESSRGRAVVPTPAEEGSAVVLVPRRTKGSKQLDQPPRGNTELNESQYSGGGAAGAGAACAGAVGAAGGDPPPAAEEEDNDEEDVAAVIQALGPPAIKADKRLDSPPRGPTALTESQYIEEQVRKYGGKHRELYRYAWKYRNEEARLGDKTVPFNFTVSRFGNKKLVNLRPNMAPLFNLCQVKAKALGCDSPESEQDFFGWLVERFAEQEGLHNLSLPPADVDLLLEGITTKFMGISLPQQGEAAAAPDAA